MSILYYRAQRIMRLNRLNLGLVSEFQEEHNLYKCKKNTNLKQSPQESYY